MFDSNGRNGRVGRCYPQPVADLTFSQPARRNLLVPILLALAVLAAVTYAVLRLTPHTTADVAVTHSAVFPSHVVFKSSSIVLNSDQAQDDIYILTTLNITNHLHLPLFLKDFHGTFVPGSAAQTLPLTTSAIEKSDLANLFVTFPGLKALADTQGVQPLYREARIDPGQTVQGYVVLHFAGTQELWDKRQNATIAIDLYHQPSLTADIPNAPPQP